MTDSMVLGGPRPGRNQCRKPLFQTRRLGGGSNVIAHSHQYDVAPDGRFLINVEAESSAPPITLLLNWKPEAIGSRAATRVEPSR